MLCDHLEKKQGKGLVKKWQWRLCEYSWDMNRIVYSEQIGSTHTTKGFVELRTCDGVELVPEEQQDKKERTDKKGNKIAPPYQFRILCSVEKRTYLLQAKDKALAQK